MPQAVANFLGEKCLGLYVDSRPREKSTGMDPHHPWYDFRLVTVCPRLSPDFSRLGNRGLAREKADIPLAAHLPVVPKVRPMDPSEIRLLLAGTSNPPQGFA